jgi:high-affinity iron transporter
MRCRVAPGGSCSASPSSSSCEVFETILFYAALTAQGSGAVILAGAISAIVVLALIAWAMLRFSAQLPVREFFKYSSWLIAVLAVVLAGKGVSALQEAGIIDIAPLAHMPRIRCWDCSRPGSRSARNF